MEKELGAFRTHVLFLPFPAQGHINPMLHFAKRLPSKGLKTTLAMTVFLTKSMHAEVNGTGIEIETISDGYDDISGQGGATNYLSRFKEVGSKTLSDLIKKHESSNYPITCIVYDSICPWALDVGKEHGLFAASFFTQAFSVNTIYYQVHQGELKIPIMGPTVYVPGLPRLALSDLPTFLYGSEPLKVGFDILLSQFSNMEKADWLLFNTFDKLEGEVIKWLAKLWPIRSIGPTLLSMYVDKRIDDDDDKGYCINIYKPSSEAYMKWLNSKETGSVVYISFGSFATLSEEQIEEVAWGLKQSGKHFLWVVRETEQNKLPSEFVEDVLDNGLVVSWCLQLEVLAHDAIGCFVTHFGWNSTLEALSLGVPMVVVPQASDQTTNAKLIEDEWGIGIRVKVDDRKISRRDELALCIRNVMEGDRREVIKKNATKWKVIAQDAVGIDGSSDNNIHEFVSSLVSK